METHKLEKTLCIVLKELVEKMYKTTELRELCEVYHHAINILGDIYEYHVDRIIHEKENFNNLKRGDCMIVFNEEASTEAIVEEILDAIDCAIELSPSEWEELKNYLMQRYG